MYKLPIRSEGTELATMLTKPLDPAHGVVALAVFGTGGSVHTVLKSYARGFSKGGALLVATTFGHSGLQWRWSFPVLCCSLVPGPQNRVGLCLHCAAIRRQGGTTEAASS